MIITSKAKGGILKTLGLFWCLTAVASVAAILLQPQPLPGIVELLMRSMFLLVIALCVTATAIVVCKRRVEEAWQDLMAVLPFALGAAVAVSWLRVWNDGSGGAALPLKEALIFIFTLGAMPLDVGPEALLRFAALALIILLTIRLASRGVMPRQLILTGLVGWLAAALVMLLPTIMALVTGLFRSYAVVNVRDALQVLALSQTGSYWSAFQADRFLSGVGRQAWTTLALSSTALAFLVALAALAFIAAHHEAWNRGAWLSLFRRLVCARVLVVASALIAGLILASGTYRLIVSNVDVIALIILAVAFLAFHLAVISDASDSGLLSSSFQLHACISLIAAWILGWPVFILVAALYGLERFIEPTATIAGPWAARILEALATAIFVLLGGVFASRGAPIPPAVFHWAAGWGVLALLADIPTHETALSRAKLLTVYAVGGALFVASTRLLISIPILALLMLVSLWAHRVPERLRRFHAPAIALFGWVCLLLQIL